LALDTIATLFGTDLVRDGTTLGDQDPDFDDPNLVVLDVPADNGVIHAIDGVLLPIDVTLPGAPADVIIDGDDASVISGGAGADLIHGGAGADAILGGAGADLIVGGIGRDFVFAHSGRDTIFGEGGADQLRGGRGTDTIDGGAGNDTLVGGRGDDMFVFAAGSDRDIIRDLRLNDTLDVSAFGFADRADFDAATDVSETDGTTRVDFGDGDVLVLRGFDADNLDAVLAF